jgi:putrescine transport system ATP-binding protein
VRDIGYTGDWSTYVVALDGGRTLRVARANAARRVDRPIARGDRVWVSFAPDAGVVLAR